MDTLSCYQMIRGLIPVHNHRQGMQYPHEHFEDHFHNINCTHSADGQSHRDHNIYPPDRSAGGKRSSTQPDSENRSHHPRTIETCVYGICQDVENYPANKIRNILNRISGLNTYFFEPDVQINLPNRGSFAGSDEEESLCEVRMHTLYPQKANNTKNIEKTIINVDNHKQGIVFETCVENARCKFSETFPTDYVSYCKQKYVVRRLMVLDAENDSDKVAFDSFEIPSCCQCIIKRQ